MKSLKKCGCVFRGHGMSDEILIDGQEYRLSLHTVPINENIVHFYGIARVWARNWNG